MYNEIVHIIIVDMTNWGHILGEGLGELICRVGNNGPRKKFILFMNLHTDHAYFVMKDKISIYTINFLLGKFSSSHVVGGEGEV